MPSAILLPFRCIITTLIGCLALPAWGAEAVPPTAVTFADRMDSAAVQRAAQDLFALTWVTTCDAREFRRPGRWESLGRIRAAWDQGDHAGALEGFKRHSLEKLRASDGHDGIGVPPGRIDPWSVGEPRWKWRHQPPVSEKRRAEILKRAQEIQDGLMTGGRNVDGVTSGAQQVATAGAGRIDWKAASATATRHGNEDWPWRVDAFQPLLAAFVLTGEKRWMEAWAACADDWALNQRDGLPTVAIDMEDRWGNAWGIMELIRLLRGVSTMPGGIEALPAATWARVMTRLVRETLPLGVMYHRSNMTNWTDVAVPQLLDLAFLLDEFRCAPLLLRDGLRDLELLIPFRHMPDGVDHDTTYGYWNQFLLGADGAMQRLNDRFLMPAWMAPAWERTWREGFDHLRWTSRLREAMRVRVRYALAHVTPDGEVPIGGARVGHRPDDRLVGIAQTMMPELASDPLTAPLLAFHQRRIPPATTSECFPVSGFFYQRTGWAKGDPYLAMHCPPKMCGGSLGIRNANAIGIGAYGADLLDTGENGCYDQPRPPLLVDGQEAWFPDGVAAWEHRGWMGGGDAGPQAWDDAPPWRWHDSERFDLAEGRFDAGFGKDRKRITGVSHHRQVVFVRQARLWVVIDRVAAGASHAYRLDWHLPMAPGKDAVFTPEQIVSDAAAQSIITNRVDGPNLSLRHVAQLPLVFDREERRSDPKNGYRTHDFLRIGSAWTATGADTVVTVLVPRPKGGADLASFTPVRETGVIGFDLLAPDRTPVHLRVAVDGKRPLTIAGDRITAALFLRTDGAAGRSAGLVLDAEPASVAGQRLTVADAEYVIDGPRSTVTPIHTPVATVRILPDDRALVQTTEPITLACATAGVEIRYTTDGCEPTPGSALYRAPFTLASDTVVKARAFRPGTAVVPTTMSGRSASLVARADFTIAVPRAATTATTVPGLRYEQQTGPWQDLFIAPDIVPVTARGRVERLFDLPDMPPGAIHRIRYEGFLDVPTEGVYTIHAPTESYRMNVVAGYDLMVTVAGSDWYPATSRHALGSWSIALKPGKHRLTVAWADCRGDAPARRNKPGIAPWIWPDRTPALELSGPGLPRGAIPARMLCTTP